MSASSTPYGNRLFHSLPSADWPDVIRRVHLSLIQWEDLMASLFPVHIIVSFAKNLRFRMISADGGKEEGAETRAIDLVLRRVVLVV